ncbi:MAG: T9SS type A sorting domain-containing protein [Bacteroidetes bacterium]|nr:T9SS type A sorting domain-containing protein [Bacteroidota bacterium]
MNLLHFRKFLLALLLSFSYFVNKAATCISTGNGAWNNAATWSCGSVPGCGDSIIILAAHVVTITTQQDYSGCPAGPNLVIYGTLQFDNGNKLRLPCNSRIYIMASGSIRPGTGGGNSNFIEICGDVLWSAGDGPLNGPACLPATSVWCTGVVLPVELVDFNAQLNNHKVDVIWMTSTEKNNSHFEVQKSTNAHSFEIIGTVKSAGINGNSQTILQYVYEDVSPLSGVSYYRLKQVDKDLSYNYSKIVSVNYIKGKNIRFVIYPNPNNGEFTADVSGIENNHEIKISLKGEKGEHVYESSFYINDQTNTKFRIIPQHKLSSGVYVCTLTLEGIEYNVKVVVS